ncbi:MAG TPA: glycoside hydrolase family 2 protein, partial [Rhizobium sp.]|nr:glycoside hydrolase family 2 protein [Rhizobium sp.]
PSHDVTVARLVDEASGKLLAEAFHFPLGRTPAWHEAQISAALVEEDGDWLLELRTDRLAQSVHVTVEGYRPDDDWFHLAPGHAKRLRLVPRARTTRDQKPTGNVTQVGTSATLHF